MIMEAAAMGVRAVATNVKGNREAVAHGWSGLVAPLGDVQALARAIVDIVGDGGKAWRIGAEVRAQALERLGERTVFTKVKAGFVRLLHAMGISGTSGTSLVRDAVGS